MQRRRRWRALNQRVQAAHLPSTSQPTNGWLAAAQKPAPRPPPPQPPKLPVSGALYGRPSLSQPASLGRAVGRWWREGEKGRGTQSTVAMQMAERAAMPPSSSSSSLAHRRRVLWARLLPRSLAYPDSELDDGAKRRTKERKRIARADEAWWRCLIFS